MLSTGQAIEEGEQMALSAPVYQGPTKGQSQDISDVVPSPEGLSE